MGSTSQLAAKKAIVTKIKEKFTSAASIVLVDYRGLTVSQATELRKNLREAGIEFVVMKNSLTNFAAKDAGIEGLESSLKGPTAIAFGSDPILAPKIINDFIKAKKVMEIKIGVLDGKVIDASVVRALAELPSKEVLIAKLLGCMQSSIVKFACVLDAVRKQKEGVQAE